MCVSLLRFTLCSLFSVSYLTYLAIPWHLLCRPATWLDRDHRRDRRVPPLWALLLALANRGRRTNVGGAGVLKWLVPENDAHLTSSSVGKSFWLYHGCGGICRGGGEDGICCPFMCSFRSPPWRKWFCCKKPKIWEMEGNLIFFLLNVQMGK